MNKTLDTFRHDCARHHHRRSGRCTSARRRVLHALLSRHDPETVVRHWLRVAAALDAAEREMGEAT